MWNIQSVELGDGQVEFGITSSQLFDKNWVCQSAKMWQILSRGKEVRNAFPNQGEASKAKR